MSVKYGRHLGKRQIEAPHLKHDLPVRKPTSAFQAHLLQSFAAQEFGLGVHVPKKRSRKQQMEQCIVPKRNKSPEPSIQAGNAEGFRKTKLAAFHDSK